MEENENRGDVDRDDLSVWPKPRHDQTLFNHNRLGSVVKNRHFPGKKWKKVVLSKDCIKVHNFNCELEKSQTVRNKRLPSPTLSGL